MERRTFVSMVAAGAAGPFFQRAAAAQPVSKIQNVVLVHGLFADGPCWSEVIARLQPKGINVTAVQNPLTTLQAAVEATQRVIALQEGLMHRSNFFVVERQKRTYPRPSRAGGGAVHGIRRRHAITRVKLTCSPDASLGQPQARNFASCRTTVLGANGDPLH